MTQPFYPLSTTRTRRRTSPATPTSNLRGAPTHGPAISDATRRLIEQKRREVPQLTPKSEKP